MCNFVSQCATDCAIVCVMELRLQHYYLYHGAWVDQRVLHDITTTHTVAGSYTMVTK